jgi:hypothetical protein
VSDVIQQRFFVAAGASDVLGVSHESLRQGGFGNQF